MSTAQLFMDAEPRATRNIVGSALLLAASLSTLPASAQPDADLGRRLVMEGEGLGSAPCMTCHGADGAGMAAAGFPSLALLQPGYMVKQLQDIQSGARASAIMAPIVASLTPAQMDAVSHYYASQQPAAVASTEGDAAVLARGEQLVNEGDWARYVVPCASCHGPGNRGVGDEFPALAGQNAAYLKQQLLAWQTGSRNNDPQQLMLAIAERLSPVDIDAVAEYLSRLPVSRLSAGAP
jgi:cytochrome c553